MQVLDSGSRGRVGRIVLRRHSLRRLRAGLPVAFDLVLDYVGRALLPVAFDVVS